MVKVILGAYLFTGVFLQIILVIMFMIGTRQLRKLGDPEGYQSLGDYMADLLGWNKDSVNVDWMTIGLLVLNILLWPLQLAGFIVNQMSK